MKQAFVILFIFLASQAQAEQLTGLIEQALTHNARWQAQGFEVAAARGQVLEAGAWANPVVRYNQFLQPIETRLGPQEYQLSMVQPLPFWGETGFKEQSAQALVTAAQQRQELARRALIREVKIAYFELWQWQEVPKLLSENQKALDRMTSAGGFESQRNSSMVGQVFRLQAMLGENAFELARAGDQAAAAQARLVNLLGGNSELLLNELEPPLVKLPEIDLPQLLAEVAASHPSLQEAEAMAHAAGFKQERLSRARWAPKWELGLNYIGIGEAMDPTTPGSGKDAYGISLGLVLPFGSSGQAGQEAQAMAERERQFALQEQRKNDVVEAVTARYHKFTNAKRLVQSFEEELLPPIRRYQKLAESLYASGQKNMLAALEAKTNALQMEIKALQAKVNYLKALAELEEVVGRPLL